MRRPSRSGLSLVFALSVNIPLAAQNLESVGNEKPFSFAGGLSVNQIFYSSRGIASRREPYTYFASGNLNISLYGWSLPLTFNLSNGNTSFTQPFNQYSLHPTWKSITAHAGYTSLSFSPYTVNGHTFLGGAIEVAPKGNWKVSVLYGRFLKAVSPDSTQGRSVPPAYQRMGYGLKAAYTRGANSAAVIIFRANDDDASIPHVPDSLRITPHENLVLSVAAGKKILKHLVLKAELATSALTRDTRTEKTYHDHPLAKTGILYQSRISSQYFNAFKSSLDYQRDGSTFGLQYERVDPGYRTLGAYYFNNDLENITLNGSTALFGTKINFAGSAGIQRDNLDNSKVSSMRRMVSALNLQYVPSQRLNVAVSWSSFQTYTNIRSPFERINQPANHDLSDTLNFTQISQNASLSGMYTFGRSANKKQNFNIFFTWQDAADKQGQVEQHSGTRFYNLNTGYAIMFVPHNVTATLTFNASINHGSFVRTRMMGPTASLTGSFFNRNLRTTLSSSYNNTYNNGSNVNSVINCRVNAALSLRKKHTLNLSAVVVNRTAKDRERLEKSVTEFTGTLGYNYAFGKRHK